MSLEKAIVNVEPVVKHGVTVQRYFAFFSFPTSNPIKKLKDMIAMFTLSKLILSGNVNLNGIKAVRIDQWISEKFDQSHKNSTIIKHLVLLKPMMRVAVRWELIPNDNAFNNHRKILMGENFQQNFLTP